MFQNAEATIEASCDAAKGSIAAPFKLTLGCRVKTYAARRHGELKRRRATARHGAGLGFRGRCQGNRFAPAARIFCRADRREVSP